MTKPFARVACNAHVARLFDYRLPPDAAADIVGRRVLVTLGNRETVGIVMETTRQAAVDDSRIKTLSHIYQDMPPLPPATLALIRFCADYYHAPIGRAAAAALPGFFRRANVYRPPAGYRRRAAAPPPAPAPSGKTAAVYALLQQGARTAADIKQTVPYPHAALKKLLAAQLIERCEIYDEPAATSLPGGRPPDLTRQQQQVLNQLQLQPAFTPHLLFGTTGSGKSEIYIRAAADLLAQKKQVLILTPEIHLTPQLETAFRCRFPHKRIAVLHSELSDGERARRWLMARLGHADIVLGTRLAIFTPMPALGLIIVDEEHDSSYRQEEGGILFSARDLAIWRAKHEKLPLIAGSATPSLESMHKAECGRWQLLSMPQRLHGALPPLQIISESEQNYHGMESAFLRELSDVLQAGRQCLIFINRRGYAPALLCRSCHQPQRCQHCSYNMTVHRRRDVLICHLCGHTRRIPASCLQCGGEVIHVGSGTQRIEDALRKRFADIRMLRIDRDSVTGRGNVLAAHQKEIESGDLQLLIGTQLIAKGHNFPQLACIGILNADAALAASDLRAEERLFALLSQVIGRGTRNPAGCRVLIQTRYPQHPFYRELAQDDVSACWQRLMAERRFSAMPPFGHLGVIHARDTDLPRLEQFMKKVLANARRAAAGSAVRVFDAVPPPIEKISNWHRRQLLIHAHQRKPLQQFLQRLLPTLPAGGKWSVEVDPLTV